MLYDFIYLGSTLLHTTSNDEMTKKKKKDLHLKTLLFLHIYRIQIVQKIAQLSSIIQGEI
jgi:hypothetical protein